MKPHQVRNLASWVPTNHPRLTVVKGLVFLDSQPVTWCVGTTWTYDPARLDIVLGLLGITPEDLETTPALKRADRTAAILCCGALFVGFALVCCLCAALAWGLCWAIHRLFF